MPIDKATQEILHQSEELQNLLKSEGWGIVKRRLIELAVDLGSVDTLDTDKKSPTAIVNELRANNRARKIILTTLAEIEGAVQHGKYIKDLYEQQRKEAIVMHFE
jgi:hypothetical protein